MSRRFSAPEHCARAWLPLALLAALAVTAPASRTKAEVPLIDGFGGPVGYGTSCLGPNDDGSSRRIDLSPVFPAGINFFGRTHTSMFVNTNGNVSFSDELPKYTPEPFPVADRPMIAPFWADVDIRTDCDTQPDGGTGYAGDCHNPSSNGVWWTLDTAGRRVVVTWDRTAYYACHSDKVMSFQLILSPVEASECTAAGDFDVEFRFNRCEWNTGDASGGTNGLSGGRRTVACINVPFIGETCPLGDFPCVSGSCTGEPTAAQAGFDAGNSMDFVEIMGSRTNDIHTILCTQSNVGEAGIWRFSIRAGSVVCPDAGQVCDTGRMGVCAQGRTACVGDGTVCQPEVTPSAERCDALDNDCNGVVDEGDLCPSPQICERGRCVDVCFEGGCPPGHECDAASGRCIETACAGVECPAGQRCTAGRCIEGCEGVRCPAGLSCAGGRCVDLCAGSTCDSTCTVCEEGTCIERCDISGCPSGQGCGADGHCVEEACVDVSCPAGQACRGGSCVDACEGALCPDGDECRAGACVPIGAPPPTDAGTTPGTDGGAADGSVPGSDGGGRPRGRAGGAGCACRAMGQGNSLASDALLVLIALGLIRRRRR